MGKYVRECLDDAVNRMARTRQRLVAELRREDRTRAIGRMAGRMARSLTSWPDQIPLSEGWKTNLVAAEKSMIVRALKMSDGNKLKAAETLNIHRRLLYEKMREYGCRGWNALGL